MRNQGFNWHDPILWAQGLGVSVGVFAASMILGTVIGIFIALCRVYKVPVVAPVLLVISEFLKNSPVLVQLFLVFFGVPVLLQVNITPAEAAIFTLTGNTAAFIAVIAISAIDAIDRGQLEAARSFGHSERSILRKIIAPQALVVAMPALIGLAVNQLQVTSLISAIGVIDLTKVGQILNQRTWQPFIVWTIIGVTYFILSRLLAAAGGRLETRLRRHMDWAGL
ncbi:amino acid ABC transporter permease [Thalassospira sp. MCCC 1A01428]|uniref:amino acid ABC transporter permease n=1 Tax=Thalassospira sp. MCCC 1A01428 TaxID=1470575 RepID=UPI000A1F7E20|nr:amino acid ABC transporter permease [Thalassospira sp. MCCC 1A01428]OSQ46380.1 glutamine ABC transporter permease [Thalassospira sp. MCCC 1A01428]